MYNFLLASWIKMQLNCQSTVLFLLGVSSYFIIFQITYFMKIVFSYILSKFLFVVVVVVVVILVVLYLFLLIYLFAIFFFTFIRRKCWICEIYWFRFFHGFIDFGMSEKRFIYFWKMSAYSINISVALSQDLMHWNSLSTFISSFIKYI